MVFILLSGGWLLKFMIQDKSRINNMIVMSKKGHLIIGYLIYAIGKLNVIIGGFVSFSVDEPNSY